MTTLSGRPAEIAVLDEVAIVTAPGWTPKTPSTSTNLYKTQLVPVGASLDVAGVISQDNISITLNLIGTRTEFIGYDDPRQLVPNALAQLPLPHLRLRQVVITSAKVRDGQTLFVGGLVNDRDIKKIKEGVPVLGDIPMLGQLFRSESTVSAKRHLLIFITPKLIDPAGNRVHDEGELPARKGR